MLPKVPWIHYGRSEGVPIAIQVGQSLARARQADAFFVARAQSTSVVDNHTAQHVAVAPHGDRDRSLPEIAEPVTEGILDQRLEEEIRHASVARLRLDVDRDAQSFAEPKLHDLDVAPLRQILEV